MADYSLPGALSNLINGLESNLPLLKGITFRELWDERFLRLAHVEAPAEASGHLEFTPDVHQFGPLDTIWQLYMLFILTDPEIGVRRLLKDQSLVVRANAAVEFIRRWCEGDPPRSKEWDELMSFSEEESADETPLQPAEEAVISLILASGGLIIETGSLITAAARAYHGASLPAWVLAPLKPGQSRSKDGLLSRVWSLISRSKTNPHHIHCQARLLLNLAQLRWTPVDSEEEAMLYRLLAGELGELPEYELRLKKEYVEPKEIGEMSDTIRWIGGLVRAAGIRRFAHVAGDEAPADPSAATVPMAFRTWHAEGRAPIQISWLDTLIRDEEGLPQELREQAQAWIGEKETREQAGDAWSKLRRLVRQHGYRETDSSLSRRVLQRPAAEGRTEFCVIDVKPGGKLYVRTGFIPASPKVDFWYEWESVARCQEWSLSSIDEAMGWYHTQITGRFKEGYVEVFPRPTWFSDPVDLKAICERQIPDPGLYSDTVIDPDSKAGKWVRQMSRPAFKIVPGEGQGEPTGSHLFGPAWLATGERWPACPTCGKPMTLLAQLNLDSLPENVVTPMGTGLLQYFECLQPSDQCAATRKDLEAACRLVRIVALDAPGSLVSPPNPVGAKTVPIDACEPAVPDYPHVKDYALVGYKEEVGHVWHEYDRAYEVLARQQRVIRGDKLGGWADWLQQNYNPLPRCGLCNQPLRLLLQLTQYGPLGEVSPDTPCAFVLQCPEHKQVLEAVSHRYDDN